MEVPKHTDVLVCGAGPVGLCLALGLAQQGITPLLIETKDRETQTTLGRACTIYPRTIELLDQLGVADDALQSGFHGRSYAVFRNGKRVVRTTWQSMQSRMDNSFHNYVLNIRQKNLESILIQRYERSTRNIIHYGWTFVSYTVDESRSDGYKVAATIYHETHGNLVVHCKYLVGADGGSSSVRRFAKIELRGNDTLYRWVRIDGKMKTNMPEPNVIFAILETKTHGNVLWAKLDRDSYRIGFALTTSLQARYPSGLTKEEAVQEAVSCFKPFTLEVDRLDWWTQYDVRQKIASTFQKDAYVFLVGDAAHIHSSAFAQGLNTGVHDATNLAWKLAGTLKQWYKSNLLATYAQERSSAAEKLISIDRLAAAAVSGDIPGEWQQGATSNREALQSIMETNMNFTIGLGVAYEDSALSWEPAATTLLAGTRSPDALLYPLGPMVPMRLHSITHRKNKGRWNILVFAGHYMITKAKVAAIREYRSNSGRDSSWDGRLTWSTIIVGQVGSAWDAFDGPAVGKLYFDIGAIGHNRYGIYPDNGAIVIVRPDGIFSFAVALDEHHKMDEFFKSIFVRDRDEFD